MCIQGVCSLLYCYNCRVYGFCDVMITSLFSTHRRLPVLKSTRVYVRILTSTRSPESARPIAPYRTSEMKNSKSGYNRTSTILVPKQISVYPGIPTNLYLKMIRVTFRTAAGGYDIPSLIAGYTARQNRKSVQQIGAIVLNYYSCCCSTCCMCAATSTRSETTALH